MVELSGGWQKHFIDRIKSRRINILSQQTNKMGKEELNLNHE